MAVDERQFVPSPRTEEPLYLRAGDHHLFAWLHHVDTPMSSVTDATQSAAVAPRPRIGLVICKPFGYEAICAHRSLGAFAQAAASVGVPTLRFDYSSTGDSEDVEPSGDQLKVWTADVLAAVAELRRRTGVERVCLLGFRLGALLATLAAAQCPEVSALIVVAPVTSGRRYLRELRVIQLAASQAVVVAPQSNAAEEARSQASGAFEVSGFALSAATTAALSQLDLMTLRAPPVSNLLVIDRTDLPGAQTWTQAIERLGTQTEYVCLSGIVEMMWTAPHFAAIPQSMVEAVRDWLARLSSRQQPAQASSLTAPAPGAPVPAVPAAVPPRNPDALLHLRVSTPRNPTAMLTERPVYLSTDPLVLVFAIVTEPPEGEQRRRGVILLNDGATYHIGANRLYVSLARRWAQRGYTVLRMDLAGLGDSGTRAGRPGNEVFPPAALEDIRAAVNLMRSQYGVQELSIGGLCAGAYHALRAALEPLPVQRILLVNPQIFYWKEGMHVKDLQLAEVIRKRELSNYWRRLLRGEVNVWKVARIYMRRPWLVLESTLRDAARRLRIHLPQDLGWQLEEIAARGVRIVFAFSRHDTGIDLLKLQGGSSVRRIGERCRIHIIDGADHIFSQSGPRQELERVLSDELFAPQEGRSRSSAPAVAAVR